jgi:hypothetical protein
MGVKTTFTCYVSFFNGCFIISELSAGGSRQAIDTQTQGFNQQPLDHICLKVLLRR